MRLLRILCISLFILLARCQELEKCRPAECGRFPTVEPALCADGVTISGVGPCVRNAEGHCEWLVNECPEIEDELEDAFVHPVEDLDIPGFFDILDVETSQTNPCIRSGCNNEICSIDYIDTECNPLPEEMNVCLARARCRLMSDGTCGFSPDCYELHNYPRPVPTPMPTPVPIPSPTPIPTKRPDSGASPGEDGGGHVSPDEEAPVSEPPYEDDDDDVLTPSSTGTSQTPDNGVVESSTASPPSSPSPDDDSTAEGSPQTPAPPEESPDESTTTGGTPTGSEPGSAYASVHLSPFGVGACVVAVVFMLMF